MSDSPDSPRRHAGAIVAAALAGVALLVIFRTGASKRPTPVRKSAIPAITNAPTASPRSFQLGHIQNVWSNRFRLWWEEIPDHVRERAVDTGDHSNIRPVDYVGPDRCRECHLTKYESWSQHGHSRMTQFASPETVVGNFDNQEIAYDGGKAFFRREGDRFYMDLIRGEKKWRFHVTRTIGWRHFQDYAGVLVGAADDLGLKRDQIEHVLPFSWDVTEQHFMPPVHLHPDHLIPDSFEPDDIVPYETTCSDCHNTYPVGDRMLRYRGQQRWTKDAPYQSSIHIAGYFRDAHPSLLSSNRPLPDYPRDEILQLGKKFEELPRIKMIPRQGISCEACHYGGREHANNSTKTNSTVLPHFFAVSPHVFTEAASAEQLRVRNARNINFTCARCHSGERQGYANGLHAWNSTEYTEAMNGPCYDPVSAEKRGMQSMTCVTCHDPHQTIGKTWTRPPHEDDRSCLNCHDKFNDRTVRSEHTHHAQGEGDHCMDCHMPHTNEGLGQMVRTHRIVNPIDQIQIEANQVNVCNLCHLDKSIDWTIEHLQNWYAPDFQLSTSAMAKNYADRGKPVVYEWLTSEHQPTRIATAGAIARRRAKFALPALLDQLVAEPSVYTRRLMQKSVDELIDGKLRDRGFEYHLPLERRRAIKAQLVSKGLLKDSKQP